MGDIGSDMGSWLSIFLILSALLLLEVTGITVNSKLGSIVGKLETVKVGPENVTIAEYLGIPYAKPPIGDLRFEKPIPFGTLKGEFNATDYGPSCMQYFPGVTEFIQPQSEDCLFLNIFSPDVDQDGTKYHVMVWIHGGSFLFGDGRWRTYDKLAAFGKVILVTLNYRLGPYGFLDSGDDTISGNYGLWDQHMAIQWVHDNIASFNGNPDSITVLGESAGSASVMYQAIYPGNDGLFQRIIAQSGSSNADWALITDPGKRMRKYAEQFGCNQESSLDIVNCLRSITDIEKLSKDANIFTPAGEVIEWSPTLDGDFVTQERRNALNFPRGKSKLPNFNKLDIIMGTTKGEGFSFLYSSPPININYQILSFTNSTKKQADDSMKKIIKTTLISFYGETQAMDIFDYVYFQYYNFQKPYDRNLRMQKLAEMVTDILFFKSIYSALLSHVYDNSEHITYNYEFNEFTDIFPFSDLTEWINGARHAEDLFYMFGTIYDLGINQNISKPRLDAQWKLATSMMTYWTNFAKTGDPNKPNIPEVIWKPFDDKDRSYLYLTSAEIKNGQYLHAERAAFWLEYIPKVLQRAEYERVKMKELMKKEDCINSASIIYSSIIFICSTIILSGDIYF